MPRGGRRPGAGAPPGNLNALKHGQDSKQTAYLLKVLLQDPKAAEILKRMASQVRPK